MQGVAGASGVLLALAFAVMPARAPARTVVTLSFDDALESQAAVPAMLAARGLRASFFVNGARVGRSGRLGWAEIHAIAAAGHEIGGHTLAHDRLTSLSDEAARRTVCDDRAALVAQGFDPISFAYPYGAADARTAAIVGACGYLLARTHGGIHRPGGCSGCPRAESIPPADPLRLRASASVRSDEDLADLQGFVLRAEQAGGGWVNFNFHEVLPDCSADTYCVEIAVLEAFLAWLAPRAALGTVVLPQGEAFGLASPLPDTTPPTVALVAPADGATLSGDVLLRAEATDDRGVAQVEFLVGGAVIGVDAALPWEIAWASTDRQDGPVAIAARARDAAGNVATSAARLVEVRNGGGSTTVRLPFGSTWRYWSLWWAPGADWASAGFDDGAWPEGAGELGYGEGDEATVVPRTFLSPASTIFRTTIALPAAPVAARMSIRYDDGYALFVNGALVASAGVSSLDHDAWASAVGENEVERLMLPASAFRQGANQIAVMIKQASWSSDDLSFDLELEVDTR